MSASGPWQVERVGRIGDMNSNLALWVELHADGDVVLSIVDEHGIPIGGAMAPNAIIEFSTVAGGGGRSGKTRAALVSLINAMKEDAKECPEANPPE